MAVFEKALIRVENEKEFEELKGAIKRAFSPENVESFLKRLRSRNIRVRDFDAIVTQHVFEDVDSGLKQSGVTAQQLYKALTMSDQAQIREFYLSKIEEVDTALRHKFRKLYQYY